MPPKLVREYSESAYPFQEVFWFSDPMDYDSRSALRREIQNNLSAADIKDYKVIEETHRITVFLKHPFDIENFLLLEECKDMHEEGIFKNVFFQPKENGNIVRLNRMKKEVRRAIKRGGNEQDVRAKFNKKARKLEITASNIGSYMAMWRQIPEQKRFLFC